MTENGSAGTPASPGRDVTSPGSSPEPVVPQRVAASAASARDAGLSQRARATALDVAREARPWRENQIWWVVGIEGVVILLVGSYTFVQPESAAGILRQLIAFVLLIVSAGRIIEAFRFRGSAVAPWAALRGGVGITVAALTLLAPLSQFIQPDGSRQILGLGLLAYGILGVIGALAVSGERRYRWGAVAGDLLAIVLGFLTFTRQPGETGNLQLISGVLVVGGVALLVLAYLIWQRGSDES